MRLSRKSEYALLALVDLACRYGKGRAKIIEISERNGIPKSIWSRYFCSLKAQDM